MKDTPGKFKHDHRSGAGKVKTFKNGHLDKCGERFTKSGKGATHGGGSKKAKGSY